MRAAAHLRTIGLDAGIAVAIGVSAFVPFGDTTGPGADALQAMPFLLPALVLMLLRRRAPVAVLAADLVIAGGAAAAQLNAPVLVLPVAVVAYSISTLCSRRAAIVAGATAAVLMSCTCLLATPSIRPFGAVLLSARGVQLAAIVAFGTAAGLAVRAHRDTLAAYADRALRAERSREEEARRRVAEDRLAIARELHDSVAHQMAVINLQAGLAARSAAVRPDEVAASLAVIADAARSAIAEIGDMLALLRSSDESRPVGPPQDDGLDALLGVFASRGLHVRIEGGTTGALPQETAAVLHRVLREALTNADKHGLDRTATLHVDRAPHAVVVTVRNRAHPAPRPLSWGRGLAGVAERVTALGGEADARRDGEDFVLRVALPVEGGSVERSGRAR